MESISCHAGAQGRLEQHLESVQSRYSSGAVLVVQPGDCRSRATDVALFIRELSILEIIILTDSSEIAMGATVQELPRGVPVRIMRQRVGMGLKRYGVTSTPAIVAWDFISDTTMAFSLSATRQQMYRQLTTLAFLSRQQSKHSNP